MNLVRLLQRVSDLEETARRVQSDRRAERDEQATMAQLHWLVHDPEASARHHAFWIAVRSWQAVHGCGPCLDESEPVRLALVAFQQRMDECSTTGEDPS